MKITLSLPRVAVSACAAMAISLSAFASQPVPDYYTDYPAKIGHVTEQLREYMSEHPYSTTDSMQNHVLDDLKDGKIADAKQLAPLRKKKLSAEELYNLCRKSTLVFGKMEHVDFINNDSASSNASAVALTPDGICATNFHVISDIVLRGAFDYRKPGDITRFVMDCDGNAYPMQSVIAIDALNDFALIKVDTRGGKLTPAPLNTAARQGTKVYCLSNPSGAYFHFTDGMVSNCTRTTDKRNGHTKYIMEITSDYGVGASGGPIYDEYGNIVALVSSTFSLYANPQQFRNFQMAYKQTVPAFLIRERFSD